MNQEVIATSYDVSSLVSLKSLCVCVIVAVFPPILLKQQRQRKSGERHLEIKGVCWGTREAVLSVAGGCRGYMGRGLNVI